MYILRASDYVCLHKNHKEGTDYVGLIKELQFYIQSLQVSQLSIMGDWKHTTRGAYPLVVTSAGSEIVMKW